MNKEELRFNNWVLNGFGEPIQIKEIISEGNTSGYNVSTLQPIELTHEILEKAGFELIGRYAIGVGGYKIYKNGKIELMQPQKGDPYSLAFYEAKIKYLHHLQNVVHDLTHQELNINL